MYVFHYSGVGRLERFPKTEEKTSSSSTVHTAFLSACNAAAGTASAVTPTIKIVLFCDEALQQYNVHNAYADTYFSCIDEQFSVAVLIMYTSYIKDSALRWTKMHDQKRKQILVSFSKVVWFSLEAEVFILHFIIWGKKNRTTMETHCVSFLAGAPVSEIQSFVKTWKYHVTSTHYEYIIRNIPDPRPFSVLAKRSTSVFTYACFHISSTIVHI